MQADELTERFIRGDVSRSTEGSGLGSFHRKEPDGICSMARFDIYLDGDLFKVTITFDEAVKEKKPEASGYTAKPEMPEEDLEKPSSDTI